MYTIERFSISHDLDSFECGEQSLDEYLRRYAGQHDRQGLGRTYVAVEQGGRPLSAVLISAERYARIDEDLERLDELELSEMVNEAREARAAGETVSHTRT